MECKFHFSYNKILFLTLSLIYYSQVSGSDSSYSVDSRVAASSSLYSMSSGSSCMSNNSTLSSNSHKSGMSSVSPSATSSNYHSDYNTAIRHSNQHPSSSASTSSSSRNHHINHASHENCTAGCLGAIPRNTIQNSYRHYHHSKLRYPDMPNRLPPIIEYRSPAKLPTPSPVHSNLKIRYVF